MRGFLSRMGGQEDFSGKCAMEQDLEDVVGVVEVATQSTPGLKSSPCKGAGAGPCPAG